MPFPTPVGSCTFKQPCVSSTLMPRHTPVHFALGRIQNHHHQVCSPRHGNHLLAPPDTLGCAFNNSRKIEQLDFRPLVLLSEGRGGECGMDAVIVDRLLMLMMTDINDSPIANIRFRLLID